MNKHFRYRLWKIFGIFNSLCIIVGCFCLVTIIGLLPSLIYWFITGNNILQLSIDAAFSNTYEEFQLFKEKRKNEKI